MYFDSDGKFFLEPDYQGQGYDTYYKALGTAAAALCNDPETSPFFVFNQTLKPDLDTILNQVVALIEASRNVENWQKGPGVQVIYLMIDNYVLYNPDFYGEGNQTFDLYPYPFRFKKPQPVGQFCRN